MKTSMGGYHEEDLQKQPDIKLMKRFVPLLKANHILIAASVILMLILSLLDIAVPYVTRIAVDKYMIPGMDFSDKTATPGESTRHFHQFPMDDSAVAVIVEKNLDLFDITSTDARISEDQLALLSREEVSILRKKDLSGVLLAGFVLAAIALARFICSFIQIVIMEYAGQKMMHDLRTNVYKHIQKLPVSFFTRNTVGRLSTRVTNDIQNMQEMFTTIITFVMKDIFTLTGIVGVLLFMDIKLALAVIALIPFVGMTTYLFSGKSRNIFRQLRIKTAEINSMFSECIGGIKVIQLFSRQKKVINDFKAINHENYLAGMNQIWVYGLFMPFIDMLSSITLGIVIFYGGGRVVSEVLSLGTLIAFISYTKMFFRPIRDIAEKHNILQNALASGERITQILDKKPDRTGGLHDLSGIRDLEFKNIYFSYESGKSILSDISFSLKSGQSLAIVGPTGSGKTSLINLIVKFYHPDKGNILINGKPIDHFSTHSIRSNIAVVSQDPYLFSGTIKENIMPPGTLISHDELNQIIEQSHVGSIIENLSEGLETNITQGGASLSSGERQLTSIARAFAHKPDLIIFDEATSYVHTESEEKIRLAVAQLKENRTSITIAHRLRSAITADTIIVLKDGIIVETGDHQTLMQNKKYYYKLHAADQ